MMNETFLPHTRTIDVYSSPNTHYIVGSVGSGLFRVLFFERTENFAGINSLSDVLFADPKLYDLPRLTKLLRTPTRRTTHERRLANREGMDFPSEAESLRGQSSVPVHQFRAHLLLGVIRLLKGYYLLLCTDRKRVGYLNGNVIYSITATKMLPCGFGENSPTSVDNPSWASWLSRRNTLNPVHEMEAKYLSLFQLVDLTKGDFFFSYTLDLTNTMQRGFLREKVAGEFAWNDFLTSELREVIMFDDPAGGGGGAQHRTPTLEQKDSLWTTDSWICPLLHGSFQQQVCVMFGKTLTLSLIGRRSRFNAGTRYLKRGINEQGKVANHVEVEQVLEIDGVSISSFCQVRGSIPTYWSQETSLSVPKPPIKQYRLDPAYKSTRMHFVELFQRFQEPIIVLNLVRQAAETRESFVGQEYANAVEFLNVGLDATTQIEYHAVDFKALFSKKKQGKRRGEDVLHEFAMNAVKKCGVFYTHSSAVAGNHPRFQMGTARTNCIDNLDRTNAGQLFIGLAALREQLTCSQLDAEHFLSGKLSEVFLEMFDSLGDRIAQQYGGSQAHKKGTGKSTTPHTSELLTSIRRYYSNSFTDRAKQDAINLFLGCFVPRNFHALGIDGRLDESLPQQALWDLENDFYLHNFHVTDRCSFKMDIDIGVQKWWPNNASVPPPSTRFIAPVIRSALWDEEDSGFYVKFEQVFTDSFFAPQQIAPVLNSRNGGGGTPPVMLVVSGSKNEEDDDDDLSPMSTPALMGHREHQVQHNDVSPLSSRKTSMALSDEVDGICGVGSTASSPVAAGAVTADCLAFDGLPSLREEQRFRVDPNSLASFHRAERLANNPALVFSSSSTQSVDKALLDYMDDLTIDFNDMHAVARIQAKYATTQVVPAGHEFSGMQRDVQVSSLYVDHADASKVSPIYSFQHSDPALLETNQAQLALFEQAAKAEHLL